MNKRVLACGLFFLVTTAWSVQEAVQLQSASQMQLYKNLTQELRCLVCQNETLAESQASLAVDLRHEIENKISEGQSKEQILSYLTVRYGDFILYKPPIQKNTYLLWGFPGAMLIVGVGIVLYLVLRRRKP